MPVLRSAPRSPSYLDNILLYMNNFTSTTSGFLIVIDSAVSLLFLFAGAIVLAGKNAVAGQIISVLLYVTPVLIAWWFVVYRRHLSTAAIYASLMYLFIFGLMAFSEETSPRVIAAWVLMGLLEAFALSIALQIIAPPSGLAGYEQGSDSTLDALTGCTLPAIFEAELALVSSMLDRQGTHPFTLLGCEIDGFNDYLNQFGTKAANNLMRLVALSIGDCVRTSDTIGRWEGELFLVLLPATTSVDANVVMNKMRRRISMIEAIDNGPVSLRFAVAEHVRGDDPLASVERVEKLLQGDQVAAA